MRGQGVPAPLSMNMIVIVDHENRYIIVFHGPLSLSYFTDPTTSGPVFECVIVVPLNKSKLKYEYDHRTLNLSLSYSTGNF